MALQDLTPSEANAFLKSHIGGTITLANDYMTNKAGTSWLIKSVNILGGTCVVAVNPSSGPGRGFFAPYKQFTLDVADTAPPAPAPLPEVSKEPELLGARNEFSLDGFDPDAPLYELFVAYAPDTDAAKELFMSYASEHSEFDTEFFDDLMRKANVKQGLYWTDTNITQMLMLLGETQAVVDDNIESPEEAPGVDEPQQDDPAPVVAAPPAKPAIFIHPDVKQPLSGPEPAAPKRRGRPPGSKNKVDPGVTVVDLGHFPGPEPAPQPAVRTVPAAVLTSALDNIPVVSEIREVLPVPQAGPIAVPSPVGIELACRILPEIAADDNPEFLLEQVVGVIRRALLLDD